MTEEVMAAEKLATMDELSAADGRLDCLKGRLERHSPLPGQVVAASRWKPLAIYTNT